MRYPGANLAADTDVGWNFGRGVLRITKSAWIGCVAVLAYLIMVWLWPCPQLGSLRETVTVWDFPAGTGLARPQLAEVGLNESQPGRGEYASGAMKSMIGSLGPGDRDFMLSTLFWGCLGYLDTWLPNGAISLLATFFTLGLVPLFWRCARTGNMHRLLQTVMVLAALGVCLVAYAVASQHAISKPSLHGRYLLLFYLLLLLLCAVGWDHPISRWQKRRPAMVAAVAVVTLLGVHLLSFSTVLARYF